MGKLFFQRVCILLVLAAAVAVGCSPAEPVANLDSGAKRVAVFEGGEVTEGEVQEQVNAVAQQSGAGEISPGSPQYQSAVQQVIPQIVATEITEAYAAENGITATDADVEAAVQEELELLRDQVAQQAEAQGQDPDEAFEQALQQANLTEAELRNNIEEQLVENEVPLVRKVQERVVGDVEPSEKEIEAEYESNKDQFTTPERRCVRHILFNKDQQDRAEEVKEDLEDGGDFAELAEKYSQDPGSAAKGGDLGCLGKGETVPPFEEAAFEAEEGEIVGPVETEFGYHVIEVTDIKPEEVAPLDEVAPQIEEQLAATARSEKFNSWVEDQAESRDIKYLPSYESPNAPGA